MVPAAARLITSIIDAVCANELRAADVRDLDASLESFPALLNRTMAGLSDAETAAVDRWVHCLRCEPSVMQLLLRVPPLFMQSYASRRQAAEHAGHPAGLHSAQWGRRSG
jgi:hypothetical protein